MQVEVAHVAAELARRGHSHQRVHVGAVHVHAPAVLVHQRAELLHAHLEHTVRAGVGDHHRGQVRAVLFALGLQVVHVDVAHRVALRHHHAHARHLRAGGVGAVRAFRDQADVAVGFAAALVEGLDDEQARVLALAARVGLQAHAGVAGGLAQPGAELVVHGPVAGQLLARREGVHVGELRPGDGDHLAGGVELHRAAAQRDHAAVQRQVLVAQAADVAQHLRFAVVRVEHRVREVRRAAAHRLGDQRIHALLEGRPVRQRLPRLREQRPQRAEVLARGGLVQADAQHRVAPLAEAAQVHALRLGAGGDLGGGRAGVQAQRVEGAGVLHRHAQLAQALRQDRGVAGHALRDALQARGPVVNGVHAGNDGQQHLRGADVAGGLLAADVLLARLQRQPVGGVAVGVDADAHQAAGQAALVFVAAGQVGGVRAAAAHRHAEALRGAQRDVGAQFARGRDERQRQQVGRHDEGRLVRVDAPGLGAQVVHAAVGGGRLDQRGEVVAAGDQRVPFLRGVRQHHLQPQRRGARLDDLEGLRVAVAGHHEAVALALDAALGQRHGLGRGGGLVQHAGVGHGHARQVADHGLEVDQRLHAALRDLGLVGRVGRVPGGVLEDVAQDDAGRVRAVVALADEALQHPVLRRQRLHLGQRLGLGQRRGQRHGLGARDAARHDGLDERAARQRGDTGADDGQHVRLVVGVGADVAGGELGAVFQLAERLQGRHQHGAASGRGWGAGRVTAS